MIVEICANSFESALTAEKGGAHRIELCTQLAVGGLTPSHPLIKKVITELSIPVHVLIRPRKGDFCYSEDELTAMIKDIEFCNNLGCQGVVSGVLTSENEVDIAATNRLINATKGMDFTFHRAFDCTENALESLEQLIDLKIKRVLSSGQKQTAFEGLSLLKEMNKLSNGKIEIMPGSGINTENALAFKDQKFCSIHLSATLQQKEKSTSFFEGGTEGVSDLKTIQKIIELVSTN
jgi:copper homeostasis protein